MVWDKIEYVIKREKEIFFNIIGSFIIKGGSIVLGMFTIPAYMRYFESNSILGVWYTILTVINWIMTFDLGIGNGLRNKLAESLERGDNEKAKEYISSSYLAVFIIATALSGIFVIFNKKIPWNTIMSIDTTVLDAQLLSKCMMITILGVILRFFLSLITSIVYAIQKPAINNFLLLVSNILIFLYVQFSPVGSLRSNLLRLSFVQVVASNFPLIIATIVVFYKSLRGFRPRFKYANKNCAQVVIRIGLSLLWLQIAWLIVASSHSFIIAKIVGPEQVVEYQLYYKIFNSIASVFALAITPMWSAVTKHIAAKEYKWVINANNIMLLFVLTTFIFDLLLLPILQTIFNIWLGERTISVNYGYAVIMSLFNTIFVLHNVNTSFSNGMSRFKVQSIGMGIGCVLIIPFSIWFCRITKSWVGVIIACILSMTPYEIIQPIMTFKCLKSLQKINGGI